MMGTVVIPSMNPEPVNAELIRIASTYQGHGAIVECGTWLGASLLKLSAGVGDRPAKFYCFDQFQPTDGEIGKAAAHGIHLTKNDDTTDWVMTHAVPLMSPLHEVELHKTPLIGATWPDEPIEIFVLDAAKQNPHFQHVVDTFYPHVIPGGWICFLDAFWIKHNSYVCAHQQEWIANQGITDINQITSAAFFRKPL